MRVMLSSMWCQMILFLLWATLWSAQAQDYDFSAAIKCYICEGPADNSTCADPVEEKDELEFKKCDSGMCLKWTKYKDGELQMIRACTADLNFHLTMIDGVCRTERNGNGFLCMCGKSMCNSASRTYVPEMGRTISKLLSFWLYFGVLFLFPLWIFS